MIDILFHVCMASHSTIFNLIKRQKNRQKKTNIDEGPYSALSRFQSNFPVPKIQPLCNTFITSQCLDCLRVKNCSLNSRVCSLNPDVGRIIPGLRYLQKPSGLRHRRFTAQSVVFTWCLGRISTCYTQGRQLIIFSEFRIEGAARQRRRASLLLAPLHPAPPQF